MSARVGWLLLGFALLALGVCLVLLDDRGPVPCGRYDMSCRYP